MARAGRRTTLIIRTERVRLLRQHWHVYLALAALLAIPAVASMMMLSPRWGAFLAGVYATAFVGLVGYSLMLDGSHFRMLGAEAERWTSSALRKANGWWVIDAVEFADRDIDHLAVGNRHVLAVETKWTSRSVTIDERGVQGMWTDPVRATEAAARRIRNLLASRGVDIDVIPVLVLWGRGVPRVEGGYRRVGHVRILVGAQAPEWRARLQALPAGAPAADARRAVEEYVHAFDHRRQERARRSLFSRQPMTDPTGGRGDPQTGKL